jgi:membrane fusion protein, multidrug efflux system
MMRRLIVFIVPVLLIVVALFTMRLLSGMRDESPRHGARPGGLAVQVEVASPATLESRVSAYGHLLSAREFELTAEVGGTLSAGELSFRPGQRFEKDQLLLKIDDRPLRYSIASQKSALLSSLAQVLPEIGVDFPEEAERWRRYFADFDIEGPMAELPAVSEDKVKLYLARFGIFQSYYGIRDLELRLAKCELRAPFDGVVLSATLHEGATAKVGFPLGTLLCNDERELEISLPASELAWLDRDGRATIHSADRPGEWTGHLLRLGGTVDTRTQTVAAYYSIDGPDLELLVTGSFFAVDLPTLPIPDALRLPRSAMTGNGHAWVVESGRLALRELTIARSEDDHLLVIGGLAAGDSVVVEALQGVATGMPVRPRTARAGGER